MRSKRGASGAPQISVEDDASDDEKGVAEAKQSASSASPLAKKKPAAANSPPKSKQVEVAPVFSFAEDDGFGRMTAAGSLFEQGRFGWAEGLLEEALAIFSRDLGPQHPSTVGKFESHCERIVVSDQLCLVQLLERTSRWPVSRL